MNRYMSLKHHVLTERNIKCENATKKRRALKYNNQLLSVTGVYNLWVSISIRCNPISDISCSCKTPPSRVALTPTSRHVVLL